MYTLEKSKLNSLTSRVEKELFENVIPFWEKHSPDSEYGGYFNCLDRDGSVYDTRKNCWLQGRQAWMFAKLYAEVEQRPEWLEFARSGVRFLSEFAEREDGRLYFSLTREGKPLWIQRKIFTECFYIMALAQFGRASGEEAYLEKAARKFEQVWEWSKDLTQVNRPVFEGAPPMQTLAIPMILLNLIEELAGENPEKYSAEVEECIQRMLLHVQSGKETVFENVLEDGSYYNNIEGRHLNPGHAIEAGWFLQHWAERLGRDDLLETSQKMIRWSHDSGWDEEFGGLYYFLDYEGYSPTALEWSMKLWWPHTEALYAHLRNYSLSGRADDLNRFEQVYELVFEHFSDPEYGEWFGYFDRQWNLTHHFKGAPYKGCFHVPRGLFLTWQRLKAMEERKRD